MKKFGLIGKNISYSFSKGYFKNKFSQEGLQASYENFDLENVADVVELLDSHPDIKGLNVTIPYKEAILPFLDSLDQEAAEIGAVNAIKINPDGKLTGYNTDHLGFMESLEPHLKEHHKKALILGTGGASKAVYYALQKLNIQPTFVSRTADEDMYSYEELDLQVLREHELIINCTPIGTFPNVSDVPDIPVEAVDERHLIFDLIYNPPVTKLMELSRLRGAQVINGLEMLEIQAERAWEIWNRP